MRVAVLLLSCTFAALAGSPLLAQVKWTEGDYGPVISTHMDAGGGNFLDTKVLDEEQLRNYVFRGRLISLNAEKTVNVVYDTEHMRLAAAWTGGYVDWEGAFKNQGPGIAGEIAFGSLPGPGWSHAGGWTDPRNPKEGPLPAAWAKYRGMYRQGDKVVLSYTVGDGTVLEMPEAETVRDRTVFVRRFTLGPSEQSRDVQISYVAGGSLIATDAGRGHELEADLILSWATGLPSGAQLNVANSRTFVSLPPLDRSVSFAVRTIRLPRDEADHWRRPDEESTLNLTEFTKGGPPRWTETVSTTGTRGKDNAAYVVDDITLPDDNPWKSWMRMGAFDFFDDGRAAISTWDGDVWIVDGLDDGLQNVTWTRFATGLHQPLGLKIVDGIVHTAGRDQITRLHDLNADGEADFYENFNNDAGLTPQRHEYVLDLQTDAAGNFYYCRSGHYVPSERGENCCVMRLPPDGSKLEVFARGLREPNGMSIASAGPFEGLITVGDNEGDGIPHAPIYPVEQGAYFGYTGALKKEEIGKLGPWRKPIVWLPKTVDQSAGGQVWATGDKFGPLNGHLLHTSYGHCKLFHVMLDEVDGTLQGAAVEFPLAFTSGIMRGRFREQDGQLYLCGLRGWGTSAAKEGQFCRVRYAGKPFHQPLSFHATSEGIALSFDVKLDPDAATDDQNWAVSVASTTGKPADLFVDEIALSKDGKTVSLVLEEAEPTEMMTIDYRITAADGTELTGRVYATINKVP